MLLVLSGALAAGEPLVEFLRARKLRDRAQQEFWRVYQARINQAQDLSMRPIRDSYSRASPDREAVPDLRPYTALYEDYVATESVYGAAARTLARSDDPEAPRALLRELFDTLGEAERAEAAIKDLSATRHCYAFDQRPGITRHGLAAREIGRAHV